MEETENQSSIEEVALPSAEVQQDAQQSSPTEVQTEDTDWIKNLRRDRKDAVRRAEEAEKRVRMQEELLQKFMTQPQQAQSYAAPEPDIIEELSKEEYVPGEKVAKALKRQEEKFEKRLEDIKKSYAPLQQNSLMSDLRREFKDFDEVVNSETLELLEESNPRLAHAIAATKDPYLIAVQSYEYLKAKGLSSKPISKRAQETEAKIEQNKKFVQSPMSYEKRPMAQAFDANRLTDKQREELSGEMYHYANQVGRSY